MSDKSELHDHLAVFLLVLGRERIPVEMLLAFGVHLLVADVMSTLLAA